MSSNPGFLEYPEFTIAGYYLLVFWLSWTLKDNSINVRLDQTYTAYTKGYGTRTIAELPEAPSDPRLCRTPNYPIETIVETRTQTTSPPTPTIHSSSTQ